MAWCSPTRAAGERTWVHEQLRPALRVHHGQLREPDVVADADPQAAGICVQYSPNLARSQRLGLLEGDAARDVYVKQVHLRISRQVASEVCFRARLGPS